MYMDFVPFWRALMVRARRRLHVLGTDWTGFRKVARSSS
jgi:hypothetical protein